MGSDSGIYGSYPLIQQDFTISINKQINILGDGKPKIGAHDKPVVFLHHNDLAGTLVELEET